MGHVDVNHSHGDTAEKGRYIKQGTYAAEEKEHTDQDDQTVIRCPLFRHQEF